MQVEDSCQYFVCSKDMLQIFYNTKGELKLRLCFLQIFYMRGEVEFYVCFPQSPYLIGSRYL